MMTTIIILLLAFISPGSIQEADCIKPRLSNAGNWKLVKNAGGVQTYVRWIKNSQGKEIRERMGEMTVNCSVQDAVSLITDVSSTEKWMSGVSENYCISRVNPTVWYTYTLFDIPWPFNKRDLVSLITLKSDPLHEIVNIVILSQDKFVPLKSGITRLINYRATWVITKNGEKNIKISLSATSSAPPIFPRPIQDPVIERIFHNNLVRLKEILST